MKTSRRKNCSLIATAASMRAAGKSWEDIAVAVKRSVCRVRKWPRWYAEDWNQFFHLAEQQLLSDVATEARMALRKLVRSETERIQLGACSLALKPRLNESANSAGRSPERTGDPDADLIRENREIANFIRELKEMSDEELAQMAQDAFECQLREMQPVPAIESEPGESAST